MDVCSPPQKEKQIQPEYKRWFFLITEAFLCRLYSPYRRFQICFFHQDYFWTVCHSFTVTYLLHTQLCNKTIYSPIYYLLTYMTVNVNKKIRRYFCVFLIIWQESFFHKKAWFKFCPKKLKQTTSKYKLINNYSLDE